MWTCATKDWNGKDIMMGVINKNTEDGWKLHSWNILTLGEFCSLVFYKEI